jgi:hypothetical protein
MRLTAVAILTVALCFGTRTYAHEAEHFFLENFIVGGEGRSLARRKGRGGVQGPRKNLPEGCDLKGLRPFLKEAKVGCQSTCEEESNAPVEETAPGETRRLAKRNRRRGGLIRNRVQEEETNCNRDVLAGMLEETRETCTIECTDTTQDDAPPSQDGVDKSADDDDNDNDNDNADDDDNNADDEDNNADDDNNNADDDDNNADDDDNNVDDDDNNVDDDDNADEDESEYNELNGRPEGDDNLNEEVTDGNGDARRRLRRRGGGKNRVQGLDGDKSRGRGSGAHCMKKCMQEHRPTKDAIADALEAAGCVDPFACERECVAKKKDDWLEGAGCLTPDDNSNA